MEMSEEQRHDLWRIILSFVLLLVAVWLPVTGWAKLAAFVVPYLIAGWEVLREAAEGLVKGEALDEDVLMAVASLGALLLAGYQGSDYAEAVAVMLFYDVGELFESYAVGRSRRNISELMDIRPEYANIEQDGELKQVPPESVPVGTVIVVRPGEKVPIDGIIVKGQTTIDTSALTGESRPRLVAEGDDILSGAVAAGMLELRTTKEFKDSTVARIMNLVENASERKSPSERFITKFARVYTPVVVGAAVALALLPPLVRMLVLGEPALWSTWIYRALIFLVISCPCALVISIPLSFFAGIGGASREGVLIKGANYMETLSKVATVVFDKTGTLTQGSFRVDTVHPDEISERELLHVAAHVERYSTHPIAASLRAAYTDEADACVVKDAQEIAGQGVVASVNGHIVAVGNQKLMENQGARWHLCQQHDSSTVVHVAIDGHYAGHVHIADVVKPESAAAVQSLYDTGIKKTVMLTGDSDDVAQEVAKKLDIREVHSELLPADKVAAVENMLQREAGHGKVAFVGDGINDAPVLTRADVGIAMGALGSDAAIEAADVVLMDDDPRKIAKSIRIARKCMRIVYENIIFSIGVKAICLVLGAIGLANMWMAIFADTGVLILAVLNAMRALFVHNI